MTTIEAIKWAETATIGEYLTTYEESGLTPEQDPGSRCGFGDDELDAIDRVLERRGLMIAPNYRGLVVAALGTSANAEVR